MTNDGGDLGRGLLTHLECSNCGATYPSDRLMTTCPACAKVLFARYDLDAAASGMTAESLATRRWDFRRYAEILPIQEPESAPSLGEGGTPLHEAPRLARVFGYERLLIKDEGLNPTGSFKARGSGHGRRPCPESWGRRPWPFLRPATRPRPWPPTRRGPGCAPSWRCQAMFRRR